MEDEVPLPIFFSLSPLSERITIAAAAAAAKSTLMSHPTTTTKHRKSTHHNHQPLLPGLPDDVAHLCLSLVPPSLLYSVCRSWRRLIYSPSFPPFLSLYALLSPTQTTDQTLNSIDLFSFDPISSTWEILPPQPSDLPLRPILRHRSFLSRNLPVQSVSVAGNLVLLAATADHFLPALPRPLIFEPISRIWEFGPPLTTPRRWCAAGASRGVVYVASGIGCQFNTDVARSVEKWDLKSNRRGGHAFNCSDLGWNWEKLGLLRDGRFSREPIDAVGLRGKLCMVNVKGDAPKEGLVYDVEKDVWQEMPEGMVAGWRGPAASMDEETLFVVDESKGILRKYDVGVDGWTDIVTAERLRGALQLSAGGGRICVVCSGGSEILVVDVVASPARMCVIEPPSGFQAATVHVLPRMSRPGY